MSGALSAPVPSLRAPLSLSPCPHAVLLFAAPLLAALLWVDIVLIIVFGVVSAILTSMSPFHHFILERDPALSYPWIQPETVTETMVIVYAVVIPVIILVAYALVGFGPEPVFHLKRALGTDRLPASMSRWVVLLAFAMYVCVAGEGGRSPEKCDD